MLAAYVCAWHSVLCTPWKVCCGEKFDIQLRNDVWWSYSDDLVMFQDWYDNVLLQLWNACRNLPHKKVKVKLKFAELLKDFLNIAIIYKDLPSWVWNSKNL